jgi:hypothetical protein
VSAGGTIGPAVSAGPEAVAFKEPAGETADPALWGE